MATVYVTLAPQVRRLAEQGPSILEKLNEQKEKLVTQFNGFGFDTQQLEVGAMAQGVMQMLAKAVGLGVEGVAGLFVICMIAIFVAANFETYGRGALTLFPPRSRPRAEELGGGSVRALRRWFVAQMIVVAISGTLTGIAMLVLGIDYWLLIAALTMVLNFIPFLGAVVTGIVAIVLTMGTEPDKVWWVLLAFVCIQQLESDVILPIVMKGAVRLPEAHMLVFMVIMGAAFGLLGIFVAPPLFAVLHHLYREAYVPWIEGRKCNDST